MNYPVCLNGHLIRDTDSFLAELSGCLPLLPPCSTLSQAIAALSTLPPQQIIWKHADISLASMGETDFFRCFATLQHSTGSCMMHYGCARLVK